MRRPLFVVGRCIGCGCAWVDRGHSLCTRCLRAVVLLVWAWTRRGVGR